jgi:hypothetical protein
MNSQASLLETNSKNSIQFYSNPTQVPLCIPPSNLHSLVPNISWRFRSFHNKTCFVYHSRKPQMRKTLFLSQLSTLLYLFSLNAVHNKLITLLSSRPLEIIPLTTQVKGTFLIFWINELSLVASGVSAVNWNLNYFQFVEHEESCCDGEADEGEEEQVNCPHRALEFIAEFAKVI